MLSSSAMAHAATHPHKNKQDPQLRQVGKCIGKNCCDEVAIQVTASHQFVPTRFSKSTTTYSHSNTHNKQFPQLRQVGECIGWNHRDEVAIQVPARH
jgi:hypothetical protein